MRTLEITTQIGCRNRCSYCPIDKLVRIYEDPKKVMNLNDFKNLLENVPKDVRIDFSGFSEVFFNNDGARMILHAYKNGYNLALYTTLEDFEEEDLETLSDIYIGDVFFHQHDGERFNQMEFNSKMEKFKSAVNGNFRTHKLEKQWQWSRAGNVWETERVEGAFTCRLCGSDFDHNVLLPNGDVYLCCQDWSLKHKLGNLNETHYNNLDRKHIKDLSLQEDSEIICRFCEHFIKRQ